MRVSCKKIAKIVTICLICLASLVALATNMKNVHYRNIEHEREFKQNIELVIVNSLKDKNPASEEILVRPQRTAKGIVNFSDQGLATSHPKISSSSTLLDDIFLSVKTTAKNHKSRLHLLLDTWISSARKQVSMHWTKYTF